MLLITYSAVAFPFFGMQQEPNAIGTGTGVDTNNPIATTVSAEPALFPSLMIVDVYAHLLLIVFLCNVAGAECRRHRYGW